MYPAFGDVIANLQNGGPSGHSTHAKPAARHRILVVDDHPFFRDGIIGWLARNPELECCGWAECAPTALQAIEQHRPDVVLLDLQLRGSNGFDVLTSLQGRADAPAVIVLSQKDEAVYSERALRAGARGFLTKAEAAEAVFSAIRVVVGGGLFFRNAEVAAACAPRRNGPVDPLRTLADRELEVLRLLGAGLSTKAIAGELALSTKTVEWYRAQLKLKLGISDTAALVRRATLWHDEDRI